MLPPNVENSVILRGGDMKEYTIRIIVSHKAHRVVTQRIRAVSNALNYVSTATSTVEPPYYIILCSVKHNVIYSIAITIHRLDHELTKDTPHLTLKDELGIVFWEHFREYFWHYKERFDCITHQYRAIHSTVTFDLLDHIFKGNSGVGQNLKRNV